MLEKRSGITLIALVITIIVMLILAGVTISALTGQDNVIENSESVVGKYNNKVIAEKEKLNEVIEYIKNDGKVEETGLSISAIPDTTGVTKKVIVTVVGYAEEGIKRFTSTIGDNKTYGEGTKEIVETCEITENGIYVFTIEDNKGKTGNRGILIENILEGTIQINVDKTMPTMENVKVTITWTSGSGAGIKEISKNGGTTWQTVTGETSTFEVSENCTIKARVRNNGEEVITASLTISNIDKTSPTVTATAGTETITKGDSKEISKYFTYTANGTTEITSVVYTDTSNGNAVVTNTNTLSVGTHIIRCTVTKETGATASATKTIIVEDSIFNATEIAGNPSKHYGGYVTNYTTPSGDPDVWWRIFYADESNIYLIADDYIHYNYCPVGAKGSSVTMETDDDDYKLGFDDVYNDYTGAIDITDPRITKWIQKYLDVAPTSTNTNIRAVAYMLDEQVWSEKYANPTYAEYAIGGPTLEMFVASYNKTHENPMYCSADQYGYYISWTEGEILEYISGLDKSESLYVISDVSKTYSMWIASPSAKFQTGAWLMTVEQNGEVRYGIYWQTRYRVPSNNMFKL